MAAAVAAFAFGQRAAILDGNVKRVLCRQFGIEGFPGQAAIHRQLWDLAESLLPTGDIEPYTQGLMDLGATVCTRSRPRCGECPVAAACIARRDERQGELPASKPRAAVPERTSTFVLLHDGARLLLERRPPSGLWGGLLVPPEGEPNEVARRCAVDLLDQQPLPAFRHAFTHFRLTLQPVLCRVVAPSGVAEPGMEWVAIGQAADAGVPAPIRKLIRQMAALPG